MSPMGVGEVSVANFQYLRHVKNLNGLLSHGVLQTQPNQSMNECANLVKNRELHEIC